MAGMSNVNAVLKVSTFLIDAKAQDVLVLDISKQSGFADYFVIATLNSFGQLRGLLKNLDDELMDMGIHTKGAKKSLNDDDTWVLLDCGDFIIHLMLKAARDFYALEKLWHDSPRLDPTSGEVLASI